MCSVQDGDIPVKKSASSKSVGRTCMKCRQQTAILITRVNDAFCRDCFQVYMTHKFRATIGKTKLVRDGKAVLVGISGGPASVALLHLIQEGLSERAHKKLRFRPGLIYIDEGAAVGMTTEESLVTRDKVVALMQKTGYPYYVNALEEGLDLKEMKCSPISPEPGNGAGTNLGQSSSADCLTDGVEKELSSNSSTKLSDSLTSPALREQNDTVKECSLQSTGAQGQFKVTSETSVALKNILSSIKSTSAKEDFIRCLRNNLIVEVARNCGYSKVMLGNCGTQLAIRLLTDMATGRGSHAAMETSFADRRQDDIMLLRPMRDFSSKEVALYNALHGLETVFFPTLTTKGPEGASIEHLTESFVTGLQTDYQSTVSNIMRTGEKLDASGNTKTDDYCAMCQAPLDTHVGASSALSALEFSQRISQPSAKGSKSCQPVECCGEGDGSCKTQGSYRPSIEEVVSLLCYGCRRVVLEMSDTSSVPGYVMKDVSRRIRRAQMKQDIQDFLLEDS